MKKVIPLLLFVILAAFLTVFTAWAVSPNTFFETNYPQAIAQIEARKNNVPVQPRVQGSTACVGGMAGSYPCENVDLLAQLSHSQMGGIVGNDIWGWTDPLTNKEYALVGQSNGTAFVDISNPLNPIYIGRLPSHTGSSIWRDIKVYENHAYVVSDNNGSHGMQIFDLTELRDVTTPPVTFSNTAHYNSFGSAHNIVINEASGYAFAVGISSGGNGCAGGLHMIDIQNPTSPTFAGCFSEDGYTHDAQCVVYNGPDTAYQGNEICFNANADTLTIADVTTKTAPVQLGKMGYVNVGYAHQGWLTEDHHYLIFDDEVDESSHGNMTRTIIWDVSDLNTPTVIGYHEADTASRDHNLYVKGNYVYESNYSAGFYLYGLDDVANGNLGEVGYFDTYPSNDNVNWNGQWSNYPYFDCGFVIANDQDTGLFVLKPTAVPPAYCVNLPAHLSDAAIPGETVTYTVNLRNKSTVTDTFDIAVGGNDWVTNSSLNTTPALAPYEEITFEVSVTVPVDAGISDEDTAVITAASQTNAQAAAETLLTTSVMPFYSAVLDTTVSELSAYAGETVSYTLTISNTGILSDSYELTPAGNLWDTQITPDSLINLAAGTSITAVVTVDIPESATISETDMVTVTLTSLNEPAFSDNILLATTVLEPDDLIIYLPAVHKP